MHPALAHKDWDAAVRSARVQLSRDARRTERAALIRRYLWYDEDAGLIRYQARVPDDFPRSPDSDQRARDWNRVNAGRPACVSRRGLIKAGGRWWRTGETMAALGHPDARPTRLPAPRRLTIPDVARLYGDGYALAMVARRSTQGAVIAKLPTMPGSC